MKMHSRNRSLNQYVPDKEVHGRHIPVCDRVIAFPGSLTVVVKASYIVHAQLLRRRRVAFGVFGPCY